MNSGNLVKKIKKEVMRSPQKSGVLALITVVAIYFWVPLLIKWTSGSKPPVPEGEAVAASELPGLPMGPEELIPEVPVVEESNFDWQNLIRWTTTSKWMNPSVISEDARDPFQLSKEQKELLEAARAEETARLAAEEAARMELAADEEEQAIQETVLTPADFSLTLASTIVGGNVKAAMINGKVYRLYDEVKCVHEDQQVKFLVEEIEHSHVNLTREGETYKLRIVRKLATEGEAGAPQPTL